MRMRSNRGHLFLALHQLPDVLERLVESPGRDMLVDAVDQVAGARGYVPQLLDATQIRLSVPRHVVLQIHGLDAKVEPLGGRIGGLRRHGVPLAENRALPVDQEARARTGINDDAFADDETLERLQLDPQRHRRLPSAQRGHGRSGRRARQRAASRPPSNEFRNVQGEGGGADPAASILFYAATLSAAAAARSPATGWPATALTPRSTGGSTAPGCWPLPRWCRPASGWTNRSAAR